MIVQRAFEACGVRGRNPEPREFPRIISRIERALKIFLDVDGMETARRDLSALLPKESQAPGAEQIEVQEEGDIVTARARAREICRAIGGERLATQKAATIVSELARNIVSYTPGGYIELIPSQSPNRLRVRAVDTGAGIANLEEILAGRYKSRTGLGMGLLGTRRIADIFNVTTGVDGTIVEIEVVL